MFHFGEGWLLDRMLILIPIVMSLTVHEWAHAWSAFRLGDDTAARMGRLTLNPLEHMDPIGSFFLPLLGIPFGWAKPVPVSLGGFHPGVSPRAGMMLTAAAGPVSNLVLAFGATLVLALMARFAPEVAAGGGALTRLLEMLVFLNLILAIFNLLPIPPLDGGRIADGLVPDRLRPGWDAFASAAPVALAAVIVLPLLLGVSPFEWPLAAAQGWLDAVFELVAG